MEIKGILKKYIHPLAPVPTGVAPKLKGMKKFPAIVFDIYGTLLISGAGGLDHKRAFWDKKHELKALFHRFSVNRSPAELSREIKRAVEAEHKILRDNGISYPEVDMIQIWRQVLEWNDTQALRSFALAYELVINPVFPMPGFLDLLSAGSRGKVVMGIVSNAQFYTPLVLQYFLGSKDVHDFFHPGLTLFSFQHQVAKPSDELFRLAARTLRNMGISAESTLYVGNDMKNDILPAHKTGFATALFAGDRRSLRMRKSDKACRNLSPDFIMTHLSQLIL